jgi:hypothetical protein
MKGDVPFSDEGMIFLKKGAQLWFKTSTAQNLVKQLILEMEKEQIKSKLVRMNLPQFNGHFKKYTEEYTIRKKEVSNERGTANI